MEIKNKLTVTGGEGGKGVTGGGEKGKGQVKEHVQRTHGQRQQGRGTESGRWGWVGQGRVMVGKRGQL